MIFKLSTLTFFVSVMSAETFIFSESYRTIRKSEGFQTNVVWGQQSLTKSVGAFSWAQYGRTYRQTYGGLYVKPVSWLQVGAGGGVEQAWNKPRLGTFAYTAKGKNYVFAIYENFGATGYWYLVLTDRAISKRVSVGTHSQAFIGHGARADIKLGQIGRWVPSIRPAVTWNEKSGIRPNVLIGLRFTYFRGD